MIKMNEKIFNRILYIYVILFCLGVFCIRIGYAIKPYMIFSLFILLVLLLLKNKTKISLYKTDIFYHLFIIASILSIFFAKDSIISLKYIFGMYAIFIMMLIIRVFLRKIKKQNIIEIIINVGIIFCVVSILYYLIGIKSINFNFIGNGMYNHGVLIDRNSPRLITFFSYDPNISCLLFTLFLFFTYLSNSKLKKIISITLSIICIILTMSRGAIFGIIIGLFIYNIINNKNLVKKSIKILLIVLLVFIVLNFFADNSFYKLFIDRIQSSISSGGSGRIDLWSKAFNIFKDYNIITGLGINNLYVLMGKAYVHNSFIQVFIETGLIGFLTYLLFLLSIFIDCIKIYKVDKRYSIFLSVFISYLLQMFFLSAVVHEAFFLFIVLLTRFLYKNEGVD